MHNSWQTDDIITDWESYFLPIWSWTRQVVATHHDFRNRQRIYIIWRLYFVCLSKRAPLWWYHQYCHWLHRHHCGGCCQSESRCQEWSPRDPKTRHISSLADHCDPGGTFQNSIWIIEESQDDDFIMNMDIPDVILMIRIIIQFVRGLELLPDRWTAVLEECIDWVLILPVDLEVDIDHELQK